jgi:hypothetical protein
MHLTGTQIVPIRSGNGRPECRDKFSHLCHSHALRVGTTRAPLQVRNSNLGFKLFQFFLEQLHQRPDGPGAEFKLAPGGEK